MQKYKGFLQFFKKNFQNRNFCCVFFIRAHRACRENDTCVIFFYKIITCLK